MTHNNLIIVGDSAFAEIAYEYFTHDSDFTVVAFAVERAFKSKSNLMGLPVVVLEELEDFFGPSEYFVHVAVTYTQLNRLRVRLISDLKARGYRLASYISSRAFIWPNVELGEHHFIFENNTIQAFAKIGDNVVVWSGNHIGHHSNIGNNCFISSHTVISGFCNIGDFTFLGVNCTISDNTRTGKSNWIGPGVVVSADTDDGQIFQSLKPKPSNVSAFRFFRVGQ